MTPYRDNARLPASATEDIAYVRESFRPMQESVYPLVERGLLPLATYVLPDGTPMVPDDHAALLDDANRDPAAVSSRFRERYVAAGGAEDAVDADYRAWLTGEYGACLKQTTPEMICAKGALMDAITALLARPAPADETWCSATRQAVDSLDAIERPFANHDRERFGGPSSRERLITDTHRRFPELWHERELVS
ncbi:MAG: hypothetical protein J2O48_02115 [Solirubrobacterales bacterium]|nr:hypothetical protein [Solirubrobacterales bacterium]